MCYEGRISAWAGYLLTIGMLISVQLSSYAVLCYIPFCLVVLSLKWRIWMEGESVHVRALLFGQRVYRKMYRSDEVVEMKFLRTGWTRKAATIKVKDGWRVKIENHQPAGIFRELDDFAVRNRIPIRKTKDYHLLERMERTREASG
ncbi:hypothetical protein ACFOGI_14735 [Virgibacillus xinjiangensis]|uniref:Uncharacterized protein n=1 Tax=Virgibacillus xinjiangensis TaxID=393090 RepID=A0ABV7CYM5_9BACI